MTKDTINKRTLSIDMIMEILAFIHKIRKQDISAKSKRSKMYITPVVSASDEQAFIEIPVALYASDKNWIRPLDKDIKAVFDPARNKLFKNGEARRWILVDGEGKGIGRIAAFIDRNRAGSFKQPTGGIGFFECINNTEAAFLLFETAKTWLEDRGMEAMDGPINFGEKDRFWGLLVEGFHEPAYCNNYNFPYYRELFEAYGFQTYFEQLTFLRQTATPIPEKYRQKAAKIAEDPKYTFEHIRKSQLEKYTLDFLTVYNQAWGTHDNFKAMRVEQARSLMKQLKPVMDPLLIWFAYYDGQPVGFFMMLPELNQVFKRLNGQLGLIGKLKFLYYRWIKVITRIHGVVFGIAPEHQGKGLEGAIIMAAANKLQPLKQYKDIEMTWIGDFNPKMINVVRSLGVETYKKHITYRKLFDASIPFQRSPIIK